MAEVFVANQTAIVEYDGAPTRIKKGVTRVESGHALLEQHPELFKAAETSAQFRVREHRDQPTGQPSGEAGKYAELKQQDLRDELARRNEDRDEADKIKPEGRSNDDLIAALEADDKAAEASNDGAGDDGTSAQN